MAIPYRLLIDKHPVLSESDGLAEGERDNDFSLPIIASHPDATQVEVEKLPAKNWAVDTSLSGFGITTPRFLLDHYKLIAEDPAVNSPRPGAKNWLDHIRKDDISTDGIGSAEIDFFWIKLWLSVDSPSKKREIYPLGLFEVGVQKARKRTLLGRDVLLEVGLRITLDCPAPTEIEMLPTITVEGPAKP